MQTPTDADAVQEAMRSWTLAAPELMQVHTSFERIATAGQRKMSLNDFHLGRTIGKGRYARVRLVTLTGEDDTPLCLKIFKKQDMHLLEQCEHVMNEKDVLASVRNPFIIQMLGTFQDADRLYMALELVNGGELFTLLREMIKFPLGHVRVYMAEVTCAISHLQDMLICFRDIKPENILIHASGHLKLTDFGFAKYLNEGKTHTVCGTAVYMAPEMLIPMKGDNTKSAGYGLPVDWYGVGILFFEMLTGKPPFVALDDQEIFQQTTAGFIRYPPGLDKKAKDCMMKLLQREPKFRLGSVHSPYGTVQQHSFFADIDWEAADAGRLEPPWKPNVRDSNTDTSLFGEFPESGNGNKFFSRRRSRNSRNSSNSLNDAFRGWEERRDFREEALTLAASKKREHQKMLEERKKLEEEEKAEQLKEAILDEILLKEGPNSNEKSPRDSIVSVEMPARVSTTDKESKGCCAVQ